MPNPECDDCSPSPKVQEVEKRPDGLHLGECAELYHAWVACNEAQAGQVSACTAQLRAFRDCHKAQSQRSAEHMTRRRADDVSRGR